MAGTLEACSPPTCSTILPVFLFASMNRCASPASASGNVVEMEILGAAGVAFHTQICELVCVCMYVCLPVCLYVGGCVRVCPSLRLSDSSNTRTRTHTHARTHTRTRTRAHTRTHTDTHALEVAGVKLGQCIAGKLCHEPRFVLERAGAQQRPDERCPLLQQAAAQGGSGDENGCARTDRCHSHTRTHTRTHAHEQVWEAS